MKRNRNSKKKKERNREVIGQSGLVSPKEGKMWSVLGRLGRIWDEEGSGGVCHTGWNARHQV